MRAGAVAFAWLATRGLLVWLLLGPQHWVTGDVAYFDESLGAVGDVGLDATLVEYPLPAVAVVAVPWLLAGLVDAAGAYGVLLMTAAAVTDLAFLVALDRLGRSRGAVLTWLLAVPVLGATSYARFDLLPGVLCGTAMLLLAKRPRWAGVCLAMATAVKLWPALVLASVVATAGRTRDVLATATGAGGVLALVSLAVAGWDRLVSPLVYQSDRGLQIESVPATPVMLAWWRDPSTWTVGYAPSKAYEVTGPGVDLALAASTVLTVLYVGALGLAWGWAWRLRGLVSPGTTVWLVLAAVSGFLVAGKVLSPQYLLWLLPIAAAGLSVADARSLRAWTAALLVAAALTQVVFPASYGAITSRTDEAWLPLSALALRNLLMVGLLTTAATAAARGLRRDAQEGRLLERQPPGPAWSGRRTLR
jgi:hypothetical protein